MEEPFKFSDRNAASGGGWEQMMSDNMPTPENESKFNYIEEKVTPKHKKRLKRLFYSSVRTVLFAAVFGLTARYVFMQSESFFNQVLGIAKEDEKDEKDEFRFDDAGLSFAPGNSTPSVSVIPTATGTPATPVPSTPIPTPTKAPKAEPSAKPAQEPPAVPVQEPVPAADPFLLYQEMMAVTDKIQYSMVTVRAIESGVDFFNKPYETVNPASGVVIAIYPANILVMTTYSSITGASLLEAVFYDGQVLHASIFNYDADFDIAILTVDITALSREAAEKIKVIEIDPSYTFTAGSPVLAVGNPNGHQGSIDFGLISKKAVSRNILDGKVDIYHTNLAYYEKGGGFILSMEGWLMGCITHTLMEDGEEGICIFAGINRLKPVIEKLINRTEFVYLGLVVEDIPQDILQERGIAHGVYVKEVRSGSPAFSAGMRSGDILIGMGTYNIQSVNAYISFLSYYRPGDQIRLRYLRGDTKDVYHEREIDLTVSAKAK